MSKSHRGKGLKDVQSQGRDTCPLCKRGGIKVIYEQELEGKKIKTCKTCKAHISNQKKNAPVNPQ